MTHPFARIRSRVNSPEFLENYDRIFGKKGEDEADAAAIEAAKDEPSEPWADFKTRTIADAEDPDVVALSEEIRRQFKRDIDKLLDAVAVQSLGDPDPKDAA
jgi:hypothetical protein